MRPVMGSGADVLPEIRKQRIKEDHGYAQIR